MRFLPSTAKRPDRVKLSYPARGRTRTFQFDPIYSTYEQQAVAALNNSWVKVLCTLGRGVGEPMSFAIEKEYLEQLAMFFGIKAAK